VLRASVTVELSCVAREHADRRRHVGGGAPRRRIEVGGLSFIGGTPSFSARDPNDAYGHLINQLVYNVTYDVRSTWGGSITDGR